MGNSVDYWQEDAKYLDALLVVAERVVARAQVPEGAAPLHVSGLQAALLLPRLALLPATDLLHGGELKWRQRRLDSMG